LCNALVCLAVWLSFAARTSTDKILGVLWPVTAFVALGLEHSVANMFLFPAGLWSGSEAPLTGILGNLLWVTLGNILGGAGGVALAYRYAFGAMRG
jgi:formate/nitrite transporter FocA (FNT family)